MKLFINSYLSQPVAVSHVLPNLQERQSYIFYKFLLLTNSFIDIR